MTIFVIFPALFLLAALFTKSRTYWILCVAAFVNILMYPFTSEYGVVLEASVDLITLSLLIAFGDRHYWYQVGLLMVAMLFHAQFEMDQSTGSDIILSNYSMAITGITMMQLAGVWHGIYSWLLKRVLGGHLYGRPMHTTNRSVMDKAWQQEQHR